VRLLRLSKRERVPAGWKHFAERHTLHAFHVGEVDVATVAEEFLARWHRIVAERDVEALRGLLAEDVTLGAPPYWQPLSGHDLVHHLLSVILETIEGFSYFREWTSGAELALEFKGRIEGLDLQGIDLVTLNDAGHVSHIDVLIRPFNALELLQERVSARMTAYLAERARTD